jgi:hypothetical protein
MALAFLAACADLTIDPLPFEVDIQANRATAAPGDTINFLVIAQGGNLVGILTDYGDGTVDQFATGGARTASVSFRHAYLTPGAFEVNARVTDARAGEKSASLAVNVQ